MVGTRVASLVELPYNVSGRGSILPGNRQSRCQSFYHQFDPPGAPNLGLCVSVGLKVKAAEGDGKGLGLSFGSAAY